MAKVEMSAELMKAPDAAGEAKAVGALRTNEVIEAGVHGFQEAEQYAGQKAPEGMTFLILELRARSTVTLEADATAFDPKAVKGEKGAKLQVGTVADWKESRKYTQLVVDGQYAYAPLAASELAPEPRFLPDLMTGGRLVFLAPARHQSMELLCEFPNAAIPGASKTIRPTALLLPLAGTRPPPAELKPTAAIRDGVFTVSVVGQSTRATFAGARASAGNQFLVLDVVVENTGAKGEIFQTRSQLKHAAEGGSQSTLDPASYQGLRPPMDLLWVPAGPRTQKGFLRSVLATTEGESGPIVLYFERDETGGRAKTKLLGGVMGVVPMVAQELLGVGECREGDSNPHSLNGH